MKRITEYEESLNIVRAKCESKNTDFTKEELKHLSLANIELQKSYGKKFVKPLDKSCSYCVITAMNCIHNYIKFEEPIKRLGIVQEEILNSLESALGNPTEEVLTGIEELASQKHPLTEPEEIVEDLAKLPLKELRKRFPNIKARSIDRFIELLKEQ